MRWRGMFGRGCSTAISTENIKNPRAPIPIHKLRLDIRSNQPPQRLRIHIRLIQRSIREPIWRLRLLRRRHRLRLQSRPRRRIFRSLTNPTALRSRMPLDQQIQQRQARRLPLPPCVPLIVKIQIRVRQGHLRGLLDQHIFPHRRSVHQRMLRHPRGTEETF